MTSETTTAHEGTTPESPQTNATVEALLAMPAGKGERFEMLRGRIVRKAEVVSPSQPQSEMRQRAHDWLNACSHLVWLIWPTHKRVDVYYVEEAGPPPKIALQQYHISDTLDGRDIVPGLRHPVAEIFKGVR
ncbi:MAG TPA: hypothetical protein VKQ36_00040 [Ktedonobacterales bacterium]|nr:hypothetical protein [Ktedonobacterales bacterium]